MGLELPDPDRAGLRSFGLQFAALVASIFGLLLPWLLDFRFPVWPWILGAAVSAWALVAPETMRLFFRSWMRLGLLLNRVTSPIVLGALYFLVFTPVAVGLKLFGKDLLARSLEPESDTYRVVASLPEGSLAPEGEADTSSRSFENPF